MKRNSNIDILKAIGIILMVLGHARFPFSHFIYLFHMPIFFMASGYCYNSKYSESVRSVGVLLKKRIISLWLPYVLYNFVFIICHNLSIQINILTDSPLYEAAMPIYNLSGGLANTYTIKDMFVAVVKVVFFAAPEQMAGAAWFLRILFAVTMLYVVIEFILRKLHLSKIDVILGIISILFLFISFGISFTGFTYMNIPTVFSGFALFHLGRILKENNSEKLCAGKVTAPFWMLGSFLVLIICNQLGSVNIDLNSYTNPLFLIITSMSGWILVWGFADMIKRWAKAEKLFCFIGQHTISILCLHFLCFKLVTLLEIHFYQMNDYMLAAFPVLYHDGVWWILYGLVGIALPLLGTKIWQYTKHWLTGIRCR